MSDELAPTGIAGLDEILGGGLPLHQMYLIQGAIFLVTASAIYWTCVQPGATNAKLADDQSESHLAA